MKAKHKVRPQDLRCVCDPSVFKFKDTSEIEPLDDVIGQQRAVQAIDFGLNMHSPGYNIFVTGVAGTGKTTIVKDFVTKFAKKKSKPADICLINNFTDRYRPKAISIPGGRASLFAKTMKRLIKGLKIRIPKEFENKTYLDKMHEIQERYNSIQRNIFNKLNQFAEQKGFAINRTPSEYQAIPMHGDKPLSIEMFNKLSKEEQSTIEADTRLIDAQIDTALIEINKQTQAQQKAIEQLSQEIARFVVKERMDIIREDYKNCPDILSFLDDVQNDIIENVDLFIGEQEPASDEDKQHDPMPVPMFTEYEVNVLVDNKDQEGAPLIFEPNPTYQNVFGSIEKQALMGTVMTDFSMVQAGSLLQANGGYWIAEIESILMNTMVWEALKRTLQNKQLYIEDVSVGLGLSPAALRPFPIPLDVKVILLGSYETFEMLQNYDSKFNKIFKVRADFDNETERTDKSVLQYASFVARVCKEENLLPFSPKGVAAIVEFGEKTVADQNKLSIRFGPIVDIIEEAEFWARRDHKKQVMDKHVIKAFTEHRFRYNLYEEKIHESYTDNTILIDVKGDVVGQVNALAVYQMGDIAFGRPSRITAETYMGKPGIINIERESRLSGNTHDKGMMILTGYLGRTFAQEYPLSLSISIAFEQSYSGVDGDSASSTELYAILSSLSGYPIHQGIAVTGSVNQKGEIQAIGGVNYKIEGFFDVCQTKGLTGHQGVIIPKANIKNLMLRKDVVMAVEKKKFHIYQVSTVEEGIELLTGKPAVKKDKKGQYLPETVFGKVQAKLNLFLERSLKLKTPNDLFG